MATIKKKDLKNYKPSEEQELEELVDADGSEIEGDRNPTNNSEIEVPDQQTSDEFAKSAIQPNRYYYGIGGTAYSHGARVQSEGDLPYKGGEITNKLIVDFIKALEESNIVSDNAHKQNSFIETVKSIISMSKGEFSDYIHKNPNKNVIMIYNEFNDWVKTYSHDKGEIDEGKERLKKMVEDILSNRNNNSDIVKRYVSPDVNRNEIPDLEELAKEYQKPIAAKKSQEILDTINKNNLSGEEVGIIINYIVSNIDVNEIPNEYKRIIKNKF